MITSRLHSALASVAPIRSVCIGRLNDKATWAVTFSDTATEAERLAAQAVLDAFSVQEEVSAIASAESSERDRQEWLHTVRERYAVLQDDIASARTAFASLKSRHDALEAWAKTKGYQA